MDFFSNVWAIIKDGVVVNSIIFEGESPMFMEALKNDFGADEIVHCESHKTVPEAGWTYDGTQFINPNPPPALTIHEPLSGQNISSE